MINREKGSGIRIFIDEMCKKLDIDPDRIHGYEDIASSHLIAATNVLRGTADVAIGNEKSARQMEGIQFLPLKQESYDIVFRKKDLINACIIGSSGSGKTRFWLTPQLLQAHSSYVCVDPKGGVLSQVGAFLQRRGYQIKVFNSIDFSKSMHYNPLSYIRNEADILKFVDTLIANTKGEGKEGDPFWTKAETLLYCALIAYIIFEAPAEDRNINTLVDMISGMDVKEDDESYMNAVDYMFKGLEKRKPDCFAVKQYKKYKLASGDTERALPYKSEERLQAMLPINSDLKMRTEKS